MKYSTIIAGAALASASFAAAKGPEEDVVILQYALTLEHLEAKFYKDALDKFSLADFKAAGYKAVVPQRLAQIRDQEATHVATLSSVLTSLGQTPTAPCEYTFPYETLDEFLGLAGVIEGVGVSAYLGKAPLIDNDGYLTAAASILAVEARHQAILSSYVKKDPTPGPYDTPLQGSQVFSLVVPFLKSCPESNPTLPFKAFPTLGVNTKNPKIGERVSFDLPKVDGPIFIHFLNGLNDIAVKVDENGGAVLPEGLAGTIYCVATNSEDAPNDPNTVAGPAIIRLENPDAFYPKNIRRAIEFAA